MPCGDGLKFGMNLAFVSVSGCMNDGGGLPSTDLAFRKFMGPSSCSPNI